MGLSRVFGLCAALLFASSVSAAVTIDLGPSDWRRWGDGTSNHHTNGLNRKFGQTVRMPPMNANLTVTRNAVIPYGSIANGLKPFLRVNPYSVAASAAVTGLFLAVDWVFDQERQEWMVEDDSYYYDDLEFNLWCLNDVCGPTPDQACEFLTIANPHNTNAQYSGEYQIVNSTTARCKNNFGQFTGTATRVANCPDGYTYLPEDGRCYAEENWRPVNDSDFQELAEYLPSAPPAVVGDAAYDAMQRQGAPLSGYHDATIEGPSSVTGSETTSTSADPVTGDTTVTTTQTTTNISYGDTTITTTNTTVTNTYVNGNHTKTETTTETPGELPVTEGGGVPPAGEWPGFCDWASIVCDWIGWTQEEPDAEPDLPQLIDDDFYEEKTIQFGSKACPPDYEISIPFINTSVSVPMQPLCDFAGIIYYMVMSAAYIIAAYITIGVARNG